MGVRSVCVVGGSFISNSINGVDNNMRRVEPIYIKGDTKLECLNKCRAREDLYEYVTQIHEVREMKRIFTYNSKSHERDQYAGMHFKKYYRAIMKLKDK